ncbi:MAG: flagellar motor stator protein MotA [Opitutales bacterium]|nr:flagellar motor stator protein MotA [Opitutales bacterium]
MILLIGYIIVIGSVVLGLHIGGSNIMVLAHLNEFVVVLGICFGVMVIASPFAVLKAIFVKTIDAFKGGSIKKDAHMEALQMLYQFFMLARKDGLLALEEHISDIKQSSIASQYPTFVNNENAVNFLVDSLRPIVDGRIKPEDMQELVDAEIRSLSGENAEPIHVMRLVGDSFPGIGICAAVLGIILTMGNIAEGAETVGYKVAAALTGTFLGVYGAYGFVNPLTIVMETNNGSEERYYKLLGQSIVSFTNGMAPLMAVEIGRRTLLPGERPGSDEMEETLKKIGKGDS